LTAILQGYKKIIGVGEVYSSDFSLVLVPGFPRVVASSMRELATPAHHNTQFHVTTPMGGVMTAMSRLTACIASVMGI